MFMALNFTDSEASAGSWYSNKMQVESMLVSKYVTKCVTGEEDVATAAAVEVVQETE